MSQIQSRRPLDRHKQELVGIVKAAHQTLSVARRTRAGELQRRTAEARKRIQTEAERQVDEAEARIRIELESEVAEHESALDESLIAAYDGGVPIRRIALDGFGNRYDGAVHALLRDLRADGRLGSRTGYQRNTLEDGGLEPETAFPSPIDVESILEGTRRIAEPSFTILEGGLLLVEGDALGNDEMRVPAVRLELDPYDPWFKKIEKNAREGTPFIRANHCTLYEHPATGKIMAHESNETGGVTWDHPVARWAKEHKTETRDGFRQVISDASAE